MKALLIIFSMMAFVTVSQAQQWAYETSAPYVREQLTEEDPTEGKIPLGHEEVPSAIMEAFQSGPYQHMTIVQAFRLQGQALNDVIIGDESQQPFSLYELRLFYDGKSFCLYFTPEGHLYEGEQAV
uniref:DUF3887 domain-containing protein n=1 Tax=Roseihalotalea indica TaxID=2867963 RepID=A0AA49GMA2_9BACT|nr:hypothetical protein K4G66_01675 [Tunicatimonas sp. TK19036]